MRKTIVIDGQQRLVTISCLVLAAIKRIDDLVKAGVQKRSNEKFIKELLSDFIGDTEKTSINLTTKLQLNENNHSFYRDYLVNYRATAPRAKQTTSNRDLKDAFDFFYGKICNEFPVHSASGKKINSFIVNEVALKLAFAVIEVFDELSAYTVFETLNSRGVALGTGDLLKNYILKLTSKSDADKAIAKDHWKKIAELVDLTDFPVFLRHYWHSRVATIEKKRLFKAVKERVKTSTGALALLQELRDAAELYSALSNPAHDFWRGNTKIQRSLATLQLFGVTQPFPLLLSAHSRLSSTDFEKILRFCVVIAFRYNKIGNQDPKKQERIFHLTAKGIHDGKLKTPAVIAEGLRSVYPDDNVFTSDFAAARINGQKDHKYARYILTEIENSVSDSQLQFEDNTLTIEHILPEHPHAAWTKSIPQNLQGDLVYRLGNLTLLKAGPNKKVGNGIIATKIPIYRTSTFKITKEIKAKEWTEGEINSRQANLAKKAKGIWRIAQLARR